MSKELFAQRLAELCAERDSISHVARDLGINRQQFARYINGSTLPRQAVQERIADYFGVSIADLFSPVATQQSDVSVGAVISSDFERVMRMLAVQQVLEADLPDGIYLQYKQSFTKAGRVMTYLCRVYRNAAGEKQIKRIYSTRFRRFLPGIRLGARTIGTVQKTHGTLLIFEVDGALGDLVVYALKTATSYSNQLKTGLLMTPGRPGGFGPMAGRAVLELLPPNAPLLKLARQQGFYALSELPRHIAALFEPPEHFPPQDVLCVI